jgi:glycosyltransferase 2 family protein
VKCRSAALIALLVLFGLVFGSHVNDLADVAVVLGRGQPSWIVIAVVLQLLWFLNQVLLYRSIYHLLDLPARTTGLLPIVLASNFLNFVTPSASLGAVALFLDDARQRGLDPGKVALASVVRLLLNLVWFGMLLTFTLVALSLRMELMIQYVVAAVLLLGGAAAVVAGLVMAALRPDVLGELLGWVGHLFDRLGRALLGRDLFAEERARRFGLQFGQAASALWSGRRRLPQPWFHVMLFDGLQLSVLYAMVRAFPGDGAALGPVTLVVVYTLGVLFSVVAVTPQGLGLVEVTLVGALTMVGMTMGRAAIVVLAYRGFSFWMPLLVGLAALRWVSGLGRPSARPGYNERPFADRGAATERQGRVLDRFRR